MVGRISGSSDGRGGSSEPPKWNVGGDELEGLILRVRKQFEAHQPEPTSFPGMAARVMEVAERPDVDVGQLAHLIEREPATCAAVLRVANSALYRRSSPVQSIKTAVMLLGLRHVANIAVGVACRALFDVGVRVQHGLFPLWWDRIFHSSMTEAFSAAFVAKERRYPVSEGLFLAGMFHDIGKSLGLRALAELIVSGALPGVPHDGVIEDVLRRVYVELGVRALETWALPRPLIDVCRHQCDELLPTESEWSDAHVVRLVSSLNDLRLGTVETALPLRMVATSARALGLAGEDVIGVARQVTEYAGQVSILFSVSDGADETGYIEFLGRTLLGRPPPEVGTGEPRA